MIYKYKINCDSSVLVDVIRLDPIYDKLKKVDISAYNGTRDNVHIETENPLPSEDQDKLLALIISAPNHELNARKYLQDKVSSPAIIIGFEIIAQYAAMNLYADKTLAQYQTLFTYTQGLMGFLMSGSLEMALMTLQSIRSNVPGDGSITTAECDEFIRRLEIHIGELKG